MNYMSSVIEKIIVERNKKVDNAILGEIQKIILENGIETKIILNEKNVAEALRNYQNGYAAIKAQVTEEIFKAIFQILADADIKYEEESELGNPIVGYIFNAVSEFKKKYTDNRKG